MKALNLYKTEAVDELAWPVGNTDITLNSPALNIFTDFTNVKPLTLDEDVPAVEAENLMQLSHVRLKLILDKQQRLCGIVSLDKLHNQEFIKRVANGHRREDLTVADFMIPKSQLKAFDFKELQNSSIGDVLETLKSNAQQHCLVVDRHAHQVRGVISASDIARKLKVSVNIDAESTFANIFQAVFREPLRQAI